MNGSSHTTTYSYADSPAGGNAAGSSNAYLTKITDPLGHTQKFSYTYTTGELASATDANGQTTTYTYADPLNRLKQTSLPDGGSIGVDYDDSVPSVTTTTAAGPDPDIVSKSVMDGFGQVMKAQLAGKDTVETTYDGLGRVHTRTNPEGSTSTEGTTTYTYDALGRTVLQNNPDGTMQQWCHDGVASAGQTNCTGNASSRPASSWVDFSDEAGHHWQQVSDGLGRLVAVVEPGASGSPALETDYGYNSLNNLTDAVKTGISGEQARTRSFTYDSLSRLLTSQNPESGTICYGSWSGGSCQGGYDANGNLVQQTNADGRVLGYTYDDLNRLTLESAPSSQPNLPPVHNYFKYDAEDNGSGVTTPPNSVGRLVFMSNYIDADRHFSYDAIGRILHSDGVTREYGASSAPLSSSYDLAGNMTDLTYPDGRSIHQMFDTAGRPTSIVDSTAGGPGTTYVNVTGYWPSGQVHGEDLGNGVHVGIELNNRLQTTVIGANSPVLPAASPNNVYNKGFDYGPSNNGNILNLIDYQNPNRTQSFDYDALNRITRASRNDGVFYHNYNYDSFGNMLRHDVLQGDLNYSIDPSTNRLLLNNTDLTYDGNGQLVSDPFHTYQYYANGMLGSIDGGNTAFYTHDAQGQRTAKQTAAGTVDYISFNGQPLAEHNADGSWTDYIYANGQKIARVQNQHVRAHLSGNRPDGSQINTVWNVYVCTTPSMLPAARATPLSKATH